VQIETYYYLALNAMRHDKLPFHNYAKIIYKRAFIFCTAFYVEFGALNQITHIFITSYPSPFGNNIFSWTWRCYQFVNVGQEIVLFVNFYIWIKSWCLILKIIIWITDLYCMLWVLYYDCVWVNQMKKIHNWARIIWNKL